MLKVMIGIDEVGRGCWAGPLLVVAARQTSLLPTGLKDSKLLSSRQRKLLTVDIMTSCQLGEGWVTAAEVDRAGLTDAMRLGVERALRAISAQPSERIIMDGAVNYCQPKYQQVDTVIKADRLHPIVSAASVYAKELRDAYMIQLSEEYPQYGFERHVGYGTAHHRACLIEFGPSDQHRRSFKPIREML